MKKMRAFLRRLGAFLRKKSWERDLDAEMESNLQFHIEDNLRSGMNPIEARRQALLKFGGIESAKESYRDRRTLPVLEHLLQDLRYAVRALRKNPAFTAVAVLSLALGIGANTAIFSLIDAVLLRELPIRDPHRLFSLSLAGPKGPKEMSSIRYGLFKQLQNDRQILSGIFTFHGSPRANIVVGQQGEVTDALVASADYFRVLGVEPLIGRTFEPSDENVAVISHRYWKRRFVGDPSVVGQPIAINRVPYTVIGVTPPEFFGPIVGTWIDITIPGPRGTGGMLKDNDTLAWVMGRLADGVSEQQARSALTAQAQAWSASRGLRQRPVIALDPASRGLSFLRAQFSKPLRVLMAMVALVLLIACANVAGLLVARASARQQEMAVRIGIGASRGRLIRQLLTESILLSLVGGVLGLLLANWASPTFTSFVSTVKDPVVLDVALDLRVFAFAFFLSTITGILFGLVPALQGTRVDLVSALKDSARSSGGASRSMLRHALVAGQIALALLLVAGATLFARSLANLKNLDTGFRRDSVLLISLEPAGIGYRDEQIARLYEQILDRVEQVPGVRSATLLRNNLLQNAATFTTIVVPGRRPRPEDELEFAPGLRMQSAVHSFAVGPRFLETMGMTLAEGRDFTRVDRRGAPLVAVVNETFARHFFPGDSALGKRFGYRTEEPYAVEIVGVMKDVRHARLREPALRTMYVACLQNPECWRDTTLQVRTSITTAMVPMLRRAIGEIEPNLPIYSTTTLERMFNDSVVTERTLALLSGFFGSLALILSCVGLYGLLAYSVERRRTEIGIRMAVGAQRADVMAIVLKEMAVLILAGIVFGVAATLAAGRWVESFLYGLTPSDPLMLALTVAALAATAALSTWPPARRAARTDPTISLRHQ